MPIDERTAELLSKHYGDFPGPSVAMYDAAELISKFLTTKSVHAAGVIGVAYGRQGWFYVAFSPGIAQEIAMDRQTLAAHCVQLMKKIWPKGKIRVWICANKTNFDGLKNPGCAEKKILSQVTNFNDDMTDMAIVAHPLGKAAEKLDMYNAVGNADGTHISPCDSCLGICAELAKSKKSDK